MCSNYQPVTRMDRLLTFFGVERAKDEPTKDVFPLGMAPFIRLTTEGTEGGQPAMLVDDGMFGLLTTSPLSLPMVGAPTTPEAKPSQSSPASGMHGRTVSGASSRPNRSTNRPMRLARRSGGESVNPVMCRSALLASTGDGRTRQAANCSPSPC